MDLGDITQLAFVATTVLVLGRVGWAFARLIDRRSSVNPAVNAELVERIGALEDEQLTVRQELAELQGHQDFTQRALVLDRGRTKPAAPAPLPERVNTPR